MGTWLASFADVLAGKAEYIGMFARFGMNCEGWFQAEFMHFLLGRAGPEVKDFRPQVAERRGEDRRRDVHDLRIELATATVWCELKAFCTNYCGLPGKNITNRIDALLEAMGRVEETSQSKGGLPLVVALLYPFCNAEQERRAWASHWDKLAKGALPQTYERKIPLGIKPGAFARYLAWTSVNGYSRLFGPEG